MSEHTDKFPRYLADSMVMSAVNSAHGLSGRKIEDGSWIVTDHQTFTVWITAQDMLDALWVWAKQIQEAGGDRSYDELDLAYTVLNAPERTSSSRICGICDEMGYAIVIVKKAVQLIRGRDERERRLNTIAESLDRTAPASPRWRTAPRCESWSMADAWTSSSRPRVAAHRSLRSDVTMIRGSYRPCPGCTATLR